MLDALGRQIAVGDVVVYPSRASSSVWLTVGAVTAVEDDRVKVDVCGGTGHEWTFGHWDSELRRYVPAKLRSATLRTPSNLLIATGLDVDALVAATTKRFNNAKPDVTGDPSRF